MLQDYPNKELIIFNNHSVDIELSEFVKKQQNIHLINAGEFDTITDVYSTAFTYVDSFGGQTSEYVAIWDDDDIYLPWHLSIAVKHLNKGTHVMSKPAEQLSINHQDDCFPKIAAMRNGCEGSMVVKKSHLELYGFGPNTDNPHEQHHPHPAWLHSGESIFEYPWQENSFVYFWADENRVPCYHHQQCGYNPSGNTDTGKGKPLYPGPTYYDFIQKNLYKRKYDEEYTKEEKEAIVDKLNGYDWQFFEERKLFTFWEGEKPYFITKCLESMKDNSNCIFEVWDSKKLKDTFEDIPKEYDSLCVEFKSDYARQRILYEYGGMWLDADMFVVNDLYNAVIKYTWDYDQVQPLENPDALSINICAMACRPKSQVFKRVMESVNAVMPLHIGWGDLLNTPTKYNIREYATRNLVKYIDESVISLKFVQSPHGAFSEIYSSTELPLDEIVLSDTAVVTLHSSQIRHQQKDKMPSNWLLQRLIDNYTDETELDKLLSKSKIEYDGPCFEGGWSNSLNGLKSQQHPGAYYAFDDFFSRNKFDLIIELGTGAGGLTFFLAVINPNTPIHTIDLHPTHSQAVFDTVDNITFECLDIFNPNVIKSLEVLSTGKKTCWLIDSGAWEKNKGFEVYSPLAGEGDVLMLHDFARTPESHNKIYGAGRWHWHESGYESNLPLDRMEWAGETLLENCVWGTYKKIDTTKKRKKMWCQDIAQHQQNEKNFVGYGSKYEFVKSSGTIDFINNIIKTYNIKSINDIGCGFFANWAHELNLEGVEYTGFDIVPQTIEDNKNAYPDIRFYEWDAVTQPLPYADLIIARDLFFHLNNECLYKCLDQCKRSNSKYLLATHHKEVEVNMEMEGILGFRPCTLEKAPFNLEPSLISHTEQAEGGGYSNRQISLWEL
tara:strand:- start:980 stop:3652 length:2673 start_codon:yes stop_codon:yes gene_type:complete